MRQPFDPRDGIVPGFPTVPYYSSTRDQNLWWTWRMAPYPKKSEVQCRFHKEYSEGAVFVALTDAGWMPVGIPIWGY